MDGGTSIDELRTLTGYQRPSCMIRWLRENGFVFTVVTDGYPRILVDHVKGRLMADCKSKRPEPNLAALAKSMGMGRRRQHRRDLPQRAYFDHGSYFFVPKQGPK